MQHGEPVEYRTAQQGVLLKGEVHIPPGLDALTGILCHCCNQVVSCSKFEAHAGQGSRRYGLFSTTSKQACMPLLIRPHSLVFTQSHAFPPVHSVFHFLILLLTQSFTYSITRSNSASLACCVTHQPTFSVQARHGQAQRRHR